MDFAEKRQPPTVHRSAGKRVGTIFLATFTLFGLALLVAFGWMVVRDARTYLWKETPCTILESSARDHVGSNGWHEDFDFTVRYSYDFGGSAYTGDRFTTQDKRFPFVNDAERLAEKYRGDTRAQCWINPAAPTEAVLERAPLWTAFTLLFPLLFVAFGVGGLHMLFRGKISVPTILPMLVNTRVPQVFSGMFLLMGTVIFCIFVVLPALRIRAARSWPEVPCRVLASRVLSDHRGNDGATYRADVLYAYTISGREFRSNRHSLIGGSSNRQKGAIEIRDRFPVGKTAACFVNPDDPTDSVLDRGFRNELWFGAIPLIFVVIGAVGLARSPRKPIPEILKARGAGEPLSF